MAESRQMTAAKLVRQAMVSYGAMILGILVFLGVVLYSHERTEFAAADSSGPMITNLAAGGGLVALLVLMIVLAKADGMLRKVATAMPSEVGMDLKLARALFGRNLLIAAMLEGVAILNLVAYMQEGRVLSIGVTGVMLLALASQFPTPDRASRWIERQKRRIEGGDGFDR